MSKIIETEPHRQAGLQNGSTIRLYHQLEIIIVVVFVVPELKRACTCIFYYHAHDFPQLHTYMLPLPYLLPFPFLICLHTEATEK